MSRKPIVSRIGLLGCVAIGIVILGAGPSGRAPAVRIVNMLDRCDPASFNDVFGAGTCVFDHPGVSVDTFLRVLGNSGQIGSWHFSPRQVRLKEGQAVQAQNNGGEVHTFTEVAEFGGGFIQESERPDWQPGTRARVSRYRQPRVHTRRRRERS